MENGPSASESKIRAFLAIHPTQAVLAELQELQHNLRSDINSETIRWARPEQLHLTLQFLGYIATSRLPEFEDLLAKTCSTVFPFRLRTEGIGCFPNRRSPKVIWAGLAGDVEALQKLKSDLDESLQSLGYVPEKRPFHPHLTLARVAELKKRDLNKLGAEIDSSHSTVFGGWKVESIELMQSVLSSAGAKYKLLKTFPFPGS